MTGLRKTLEVLGSALFLMLSVYLLEWFSGQSDAPALSLTAKLAFTFALCVFGAGLLRHLDHLGGSERLALPLRAIVFGAPWYVWMIIVTSRDSLETLGPLVGGVTFGLLSAASNRPRPEAPPLPQPTKPVIWTLVLLTAFFVVASHQTWVNDTAYILFVLILSISVASPGGQKWSDIRWHHWIMTLLATAALLTGLMLG